MNNGDPFLRALFLAFALLGGASSRADVFLVADPTADRIARVNSAGVVSNAVSTGLNTPEQAVTDAMGNLYVADSGAGKVFQFPAAGGGPIQVGNDVAGVTALAFDAAGVLHVAVPGDRTIRKLDGNSFVSVVTLPAGTPRSFAFDPASGDIFIADNTGHKIYQAAPGGNASVLSNDVTAPFAVAFDMAGKLHATDTQFGGRIVFFAGGNANNNAKEVSRNLGAVRGLAFDRANDAHYLTSSGELRKVTGKTTNELVAGGLGDARLLTARSAIMQVVAFTKQTLTDPNGATFASLGSPAIGGGFVAFKASLTAGLAGVASSNAPTLWRADSSGALTLLARKTFPLPGDAGSSVVSVTDPVLNNNGDIAFTAKYLTGAAAGVAIVTDATGGPLAPLVRTGDSAPGLDPNVKFSAFKQLVLADDAGPTFLATVSGPGISPANNLGLWSADSSGSVGLVVRKGDTITAGGKPRKLSSLALFKGTRMSLGQGRHAALGRQFTFTAKFTDGFTAILLVQPGTAPIVLAEKSGLVGAAIAGATFAGFGSPCVTKDASDFGFLGKLTPNFGGVTTANAGAVFAQAMSTNDLVAQKTFAAPGVTGAFFATLGDPVLSPSGGLAFFGKMKPGLGGVLTSTAAGLWADTGSGLDIAVRQGDAAPGISGSVKFTAFKQFILPDTGGVVFTASVAGSGINSGNNLGLWADDGAGGIDLLIRKGDKLRINGQMRTVTAFTIFKAIAGVTGQSRQFDAAGSVACQVACSDGTKAILTFRRP